VDLILLLAGWTVAIVAITLLVQRRRERRRRMLEQQTLQKLGFSFGGNFQPFKDTDVRGLSVLRCDPSAIFDLTMSGKVGDSSAVICDLICASQHCRSVRAVTIAAFRSPSGVGLPVFRIASRDQLHYMNDAMHACQIENERELGKGLVLQSSDNRKADEFFPQSKISGLQSCVKRFCIESSPDWVFVYRPCARVDRKELSAFASETSAIARVLFAAGTQGTVGSVSAAAAGV
jgi:hypothetical protein